MKRLVTWEYKVMMELNLQSCEFLGSPSMASVYQNNTIKHTVDLSYHAKGIPEIEATLTENTPYSA